MFEVLRALLRRELMHRGFCMGYRLLRKERTRHHATCIFMISLQAHSKDSNPHLAALEHLDDCSLQMREGRVLVEDKTLDLIS